MNQMISLLPIGVLLLYSSIVTYSTTSSSHDYEYVQIYTVYTIQRVVGGLQYCILNVTPQKKSNR